MNEPVPKASAKPRPRRWRRWLKWCALGGAALALLVGVWRLRHDDYLGAAAGIIGVLVTRNHPSVIYPETAVTFQTQNAITINTGSVPGAYRYVGPDDYSRPKTQVVQRAPAPRRTSRVPR